MNIVLKLSKLCNLRCTYCYEYGHLAESARMPLDGLDFFLRTLAEHRTDSDTPLSFALHGGEPLLLPPAYLRALVGLQQKHLGPRGIPYRNSAQTNLYRVRPQTLRLCEELQIGIGVSLDVHGNERVDVHGREVQETVKRNLRDLIASGLPRRLRMGGISVLHAGNVERAADTFRFFAGLGLDYRILPIFSMEEPPARMRHLMLHPDRIVAALQAVFHARLAWRGPRIRVFPLDDYFEAAVRFSGGLPVTRYDPLHSEWALIVDTRGDAYTHSEAYDASHRLGNVFRQPVAEIMESAARHRLLRLRAERAKTCGRCDFGRSCSGLPVIEAVPSEREYDRGRRLRCTVAQPTIAYLAKRISDLPSARTAAG